MTPKPHLPRPCSLALGFTLGIACLSPGALADERSATPAASVTQIARYSVIYPAPTLDQQDLLAMTAPLRVPAGITTVGGAVEWVLEPSGYRLVAPDRLSTAVNDLLNLPLPAAHRHFEALPLKEVLSLLVGPAFLVVQDPVHRLIAFEPCRDVASQPAGHSPQQNPKPQRGSR